MSATEVPFTSLLSKIVDNRGRTAPIAATGVPLIATNCIKEDALYPVFEKVRFVDQATYDTWFRGHPEPGDIVFVCKGSPGRVALVPDPVSFCIAQDMVAVRADTARVDPRYLFAVLRSRVVRTQIDNMHVGTLIPHFKKGDFEHLMIPLVDRDRQVSIGSIYFDLSNKIESNRRAINLAESLADALFEQDAQSEVELASVSEVVMGTSPPGTSYNEDCDGTPFYQGVRDFGRRYPGRRVWTTQPARLARDNDTLLSVRAPVGELNRAWETCCVGRGVAAIHSRTPSTVFYALRAAKAVWVPFQQEGTVFGAINKTDLAKALVPWPSDQRLEGLEADLAAIDAKIRSLCLEIIRLAELRDALLPELISGRIRIPESVCPGAAA